MVQQERITINGFNVLNRNTTPTAIAISEAGYTYAVLFGLGHDESRLDELAEDIKRFGHWIDPEWINGRVNFNLPLSDLVNAVSETLMSHKVISALNDKYVGLDNKYISKLYQRFEATEHAKLKSLVTWCENKVNAISQHRKQWFGVDWMPAHSLLLHYTALKEFQNRLNNVSEGLAV